MIFWGDSVVPERMFILQTAGLQHRITGAPKFGSKGQDSNSQMTLTGEKGCSGMADVEHYLEIAHEGDHFSRI